MDGHWLLRWLGKPLAALYSRGDGIGTVDAYRRVVTALSNFLLLMSFVTIMGSLSVGPAWPNEPGNRCQFY